MNDGAKLPKKEIEVLKRLRTARLRLKKSQPEFAAVAGIKTGTYANYETFKATLPVDVALKICDGFEISERWLALGEGLFETYLSLRSLADEKGFDFSVRVPFRYSYDTSLRWLAEERLSDIPAFKDLGHRLSWTFFDDTSDFIVSSFPWWEERFKEDGLDKPEYFIAFVNHIRQFGDRIINDIKNQVRYGINEDTGQTRTRPYNETQAPELAAQAHAKVHLERNKKATTIEPPTVEPVKKPKPAKKLNTKGKAG